MLKFRDINLRRISTGTKEMFLFHYSDILSRYSFYLGRYYDMLVLVIKRLDHLACMDSFFDWHLLHKLVAMREESDAISEFFEENLR